MSPLKGAELGTNEFVVYVFHTTGTIQIPLEKLAHPQNVGVNNFFPILGDPLPAPMHTCFP